MKMNKSIGMRKLAVLTFLSLLTGLTFGQKEKVYTTLEEAFITPQKVYKLSLSRIGELTEEIVQFKNLESLKVYESVSETLLKEMGKLKNLKEIILDDIDMVGTISSLPKEIAKLKNLKY